MDGRNRQASRTLRRNKQLFRLSAWALPWKRAHQIMEATMPNIRARYVLGVAATAALAACGVKTTVQPTPASRAFDPVCVEGVTVFDDFSKVPYDYYEVAFVQSSSNGLYTGNGDALLAMRKRAGEQGANAIVVNDLAVKDSPVKDLGAAL